MENNNVIISVNALSGCYLISTNEIYFIKLPSELCQCPLGLLPHFYKAVSSLFSKGADIGVNALSGCYLISTMIMKPFEIDGMECQCPLGLLPHFYGTPSKT